MRFGIIVLVVAFSTSVAASAAEAAPTLTDDMQVAREYWGWSRSPQCTTEEFSEAEFFWAGEEEAEGTALVPGRCWLKVLALGLLEAHLRQLAPGEEGYIAAAHVPVKARELRCRITVHEYGHMLGLGHDPNESNPMFWKVTFKPVIPGCEARMAAPRRPKHPRLRRYGSAIARPGIPLSWR